LDPAASFRNHLIDDDGIWNAPIGVVFHDLDLVVEEVGLVGLLADDMTRIAIEVSSPGS
jgi:hypothetical protein